MSVKGLYARGHYMILNGVLADKDNNLGKTIKRRRLMAGLTLSELSHRADVSASHLGRIERGECFPSTRVLRKIAEPLGFSEAELFFTAATMLVVSDHHGTYQAAKEVLKSLKESMSVNKQSVKNKYRS